VPFSFNSDSYKNSFPVEVIESLTLPNTNHPGQEFWQMTFMRLQVNNKQEWEPMPSSQPCRLQGCAIAPWHIHYRLYESDRPGSPAHRFIMGLKDKSFIVIGQSKELLGKRLVIEEVITPGGTKTDGEKYRDSYNYYPIGVPSVEGEIPQASVDELPWNVPVQAAPAAIAPVVTNGTTNGTMSNDDALVKLALLIDGKNDVESRAVAREDADLKTNGAFMLSLLQGQATKALIEKGYMTKDEQGYYHLVSN
jgi:hypothetical protein